MASAYTWTLVFMAGIIWMPRYTSSYPGRGYRETLESSVSANKSAPLLLEIFYESLCPDSINFVLRQLLPTMRKIGSIVKIDLIPFGKATWHQSGSGYAFRCHHGPPECKGNLVQTCGFHIGKQHNETAALEFVSCTMQAYDPSAVASRCAKRSRINVKTLLDCVTTSAGNHLQREMAVRTEALKPQLTWVPWIVVNGVHNEYIQRLGSSNLLSMLCSVYQGQSPPSCRHI